MGILRILLAAACVLCVCLGFAYLRIRSGLRALYRQLEEVAEGSHIELTVDSRQRTVLELCRMLNRILREKDGSYLQYEHTQKLLRQNITGLAHDIRTPLTGAYGYLQMAQESTDREKQSYYLQTAKTRMSELEEMLEELFLYTKVTSQDFQVSLEKVQILPLLGDCLFVFYAQFETRGISPTVEFESEECFVLADREALRRIFLNLIQNALIHGTGGISVIQLGNRMSFENPVHLDSPIDTEQIFDMFYKSDSTRGKGSSGLGLFIVKELMRKMGGEVQAEMAENLLRITLNFQL